MLVSELHPHLDDPGADARRSDFLVGAIDFCRAHDMSITQVAGHGWLVRRDPDVVDPGRVLACVEERDHDFEVMEVGGGFRWTTHTTLREAVAHLARGNAPASPVPVPVPS